MIFATVAMTIFWNCKENALFKMIITQKPMTELPYRPDLCGCHSGLNLVHFGPQLLALEEKCILE